MTIGIGIIGYGRATQVFHLPLLKACPAFKVIGIASSKTSNELPIDIQHYATPSELLQNHQIEAVVIVTPNDSHYTLAKAALLANKHVVLEKPMCLTVEEGQELISLAQQQQRFLTVFHNRRLDSDFLTLRQIIAENRVGTIHRLISCWDRYRPHVQQRWREQKLPGSGIWYDLGPHLIDQALQLFGAPKAVTGRCLMLRPNSEAIDYAQVTLHYPDKEVLLGTSLIAVHLIHAIV
ncbi:Gfo/Idh/MocA family oxidoreductase [Suttonella ornithocola]|uniref:Gfo/Idh/MocA family oxidoreductase n=1 Tax=Suttonella ornithocola TaxID=279832 RepID=UPI000A036F2A|nr:Gfo/Idh/MocA family oxidoreductase [Suttonella ornithocola]